MKFGFSDDFDSLLPWDFPQQILLHQLAAHPIQQVTIIALFYQNLMSQEWYKIHLLQTPYWDYLKLFYLCYFNATLVIWNIF